MHNMLIHEFTPIRSQISPKVRHSLKTCQARNCEAIISIYGHCATRNFPVSSFEQTGLFLEAENQWQMECGL